MKFLKAVSFVGLLVWPLLSVPCYAERLPRPAGADERVKKLTYHENEVYELKGHYGFTTAVEFSQAEQIETISIGDSESWQITKPARPNILFVKPLEPHAQTNMTVFTSHHVYSFELAAQNAESAGSGNLTFRLKFTYPESGNISTSANSGPDYGLYAHRPVSAWNFDYSYAGSSSLKPLRVFDDGIFTYFQFSDHSTLPAVFSVDASGNESLVNFTMQGEYLVVSRTARQFTLRDGDRAVCIFNAKAQQNHTTQNEPAPLVSIKTAKSKNTAPIPTRKPDPQNAFHLAWLFGSKITKPDQRDFNK